MARAADPRAAAVQRRQHLVRDALRRAAGRHGVEAGGRGFEALAEVVVAVAEAAEAWGGWQVDERGGTVAMTPTVAANDALLASRSKGAVHRGREFQVRGADRDHPCTHRERHGFDALAALVLAAAEAKGGAAAG